jgi:hypothetical protein
MMPHDGRTPIDALSRGRLRAWKHQALRRYARVIAVYNGELFGKLDLGQSTTRGPSAS